MAGGERLICAATALEDGGQGVRFRLRPGDEYEDAFAVRWCGRAVAYINRCPHAGTQLDWQPGEFFDLSGLYLACSTHGALFEPGSGRCVAGPCRGASLEPLAIRERDGQVFLLNHNPAEHNDIAP
ncbi:MAG TPA: Rieske 2Fe-2S domain-containing protein [Usitatibacter sp.]|nr:Rieske 2Fe-2S domain-containing protein [Usitatibacter sp.]